MTKKTPAKRSTISINKFSFAQMTSNSSGKTSASGTMGVFTITIGLITFMVGAVDYFIEAKNDIMVQSIILIGIGAGLLGYRKSKDNGSEVLGGEEEYVEATEGDKPLNS